MDWLPLLKDASASEYSNSPWICMFGTSDTNCIPYLRTVVIRLIDDEGRVYVASDARSDKNEQVKENPAGAITVWLPSKRTQFRLEGTVEVIGWATVDQSVRQRIWNALTDSTRAMFDWPDPGKPREHVDGSNHHLFASSTPTNSPIPESFEVLRLKPRKVERLLLTEHPHRRTRWSGPAWRGEEINP